MPPFLAPFPLEKFLHIFIMIRVNSRRCVVRSPIFWSPIHPPSVRLSLLPSFLCSSFPTRSSRGFLQW